MSIWLYLVFIFFIFWARKRLWNILNLSRWYDFRSLSKIFDKMEIIWLMADVVSDLFRSILSWYYQIRSYILCFQAASLPLNDLLTSLLNQSTFTDIPVMLGMYSTTDFNSLVSLICSSHPIFRWYCIYYVFFIH